MVKIQVIMSCKRFFWVWIKWIPVMVLVLLWVPTSAQHAQLDSLISLSEKLPDDTTKVIALLEIASKWEDKDYKKSLLYAKKALSLSEMLSFTRGIMLAEEIIGVSYFLQRDHPEAIQAFSTALTMSTEIQDKKGIATLTYNLGCVYSDLGDYEKALEYFLTALNLKDYTDYVSEIYGHLSHIYDKIGNIAESERYAELSVKISEKSKYPADIIWAYLIKGDRYSDKGQIEEAKEMYEIAWKFAQENKIEFYKDSILDGLANLSMRAGKLNDALHYMQEAIRIYKRRGADPLPEYLINLSEIYYKQKNYPKSIQVAQEVLELTKNKGTKAFSVEIYDLLANNYAALGAYKKAHNIRKTQLEAQKNIHESNSAEALAKMQTRFQIKEQEAENERLKREGIRNKKQLQLSQNVVRQQRVITGISIFGFLLVSGLFFYVFRLLKQIGATNQRLEAQSQDLLVAKNKAESAAKAKSEFLSVMSHEIRTPMNAVIGMTEFLMDEEPRKDQMEYLETLKFSGSNLIALINDILDFSKIEAGKLTLEQADIDLRSVVKSITASMAIKGQDKGIEVGYEYDEDLADFYMGDSVRLGQVLINLMGNAVKFTEEGHVKLRVSPMEGNKLRFSVKDTGIGIPKDKQRKIFEAFSQADDNTTRKFGGTGLGLSISRRLVSLMGGELQIESEAGKGSKFFFDITLPKSEKRLSSQTEQIQQGNLTFGSLAGTRVLIAEDNKINQMVARKFLEKWELEVSIVNNGQEAVEAWESESYDLILMDMNMPVVNGPQATRLIREREGESEERIPILAFTASVLDDEIKAVYDAGMDDWVGKPFEPNVLFQKIKKYTTKPLMGVG